MIFSAASLPFDKQASTVLWHRQLSEKNPQSILCFLFIFWLTVRSQIVESAFISLSNFTKLKWFFLWLYRLYLRKIYFILHSYSSSIRLHWLVYIVILRLEFISWYRGLQVQIDKVKKWKYKYSKPCSRYYSLWYNFDLIFVLN